MSFRNMERGMGGRGALWRMEEQLQVGMSQSVRYPVHMLAVWMCFWRQDVAEGSLTLFDDDDAMKLCSEDRSACLRTYLPTVAYASPQLSGVAALAPLRGCTEYFRICTP
jgi:hypothetical protein